MCVCVLLSYIMTSDVLFFYISFSYFFFSYFFFVFLFPEKASCKVSCQKETVA